MLRQAVRGVISAEQISKALPKLGRYFRDSPRKRQQQAAHARHRLNTAGIPVEGFGPLTHHESVLKFAHMPITGEGIRDGGRIWLVEYTPPDARRAERRMLEIVAQAGDDGISLVQVRTQLGLEGLGEPAIQRALKQLRDTGKVGVYTTDGQALLSEAIPDECLLRLPRAYRPPTGPEPPGRPFTIPVGPYRLLDQMEGDLRSRLQEAARIREVVFTVRPFEAAPDPLFGRDEEAQHIARENIEHRLTWKFEPPITRDVLMTLVRRLRERLGEKGDVTAEMTVGREVADHGAG